MKNTIFLLSVVMMLFFLESCCGNCGGLVLGIFDVSSEGRTWVDYARGGVRTRQFTDGATNMIAEYTAPTATYETYSVNCTVDPRCGQCCDLYDAEAIYVRLQSNLGTPVFDITLRPDFTNYSLDTKPTDSGDIIEITANNALTGRWYLPDPQQEPTVTLNGTTFLDVITVRDALISSDPDAVIALYFTQNRGIVGFEQKNGKVWSLVP